MATLGSAQRPRRVQVSSRRKIPGMARYLYIENHGTYAGKDVYTYLYLLPPEDVQTAVKYGGELVPEVADAID